MKRTHRRICSQKDTAHRCKASYKEIRLTQGQRVSNAILNLSIKTDCCKNESSDAFCSRVFLPMTASLEHSYQLPRSCDVLVEGKAGQ